jgi:hypothetical protein
MFLAGAIVFVSVITVFGVIEIYKKLKEKFLSGRGVKFKEFLARLNKLESELEKLK